MPHVFSIKKCSVSISLEFSKELKREDYILEGFYHQRKQSSIAILRF